MITWARIRRSAMRESGITMIIAILVLFISSLLVAAAFVAANGDVKLTRANTNEKKAYHAAMAGISAYKYQLNAEPRYWLKCPSIPASGEDTIPKATEEKYKVKTLPSEGHSTCEENKQNSIINPSGSADGAFEIESREYTVRARTR